ncbi:hypothetical protein EW146_g9209 [Bondarzewia mesenterica]|uniref:Phytase-like domain-containing protein n=1 Tax=Bondarzewia mesenterica TaxID=1095465 RepID=A0A4S4L838_9AGAM|nr:hypothetical protein EW146_g9209 [Bondarzewia mesenterica]
MILSALAIQLLALSLCAHARPSRHAHTALSKPTKPDPSLTFSVSINGKMYVNKVSSVFIGIGLVGFGFIPSNATESTGALCEQAKDDLIMLMDAGFVGDTIGGIGSAIALSSFSKSLDGSYSGTLIVQPDRGFNVDGTVNYQGRHHSVDFVFSPYYDTAPLSFTDAQQTLRLTYRDTTLYFERKDVNTTGLDATGVRQAQSGFPQQATADPPMPISSQMDDRLTLDLEGLVLNSDGSFWASDEYGPYIYRFTENGQLLQTIQPPGAILPFTDGDLNFSSENNPDTGRAGNQGRLGFSLTTGHQLFTHSISPTGFEGLSVDSSGDTLYALLQSATIQDGGNKKSHSRNTRLLAYDISGPSVDRPALIGEWVVSLPQDSDGKTLAASELHFVSPGVFLVLARDGGGHGGNGNESAYKQADLIDISNATDIHGTEYDDPLNPIAKKGVLDSSITPATYVGFVSFINGTQLARFGLHNGECISQAR